MSPHFNFPNSPRATLPPELLSLLEDDMPGNTGFENSLPVAGAAPRGASALKVVDALNNTAMIAEVSG